MTEEDLKQIQQIVDRAVEPLSRRSSAANEFASGLSPAAEDQINAAYGRQNRRGILPSG